ncbi:hypothetical protein AGABI2DRAFT_145657 [Agaricus bisporus var. bisporus H97]|uniref:hypothetical protein n=1 Tax=Agaricus bisporus var. bisporus (strain H97 / ATCC MYA-4626 / FGSC 10389) TaxID=936046 RepID=UPI00029F60BE|nr:hypothetical protein AGABI2DRAFT_145657 [Agaricus bisporus var. bisporus H97]EKV44278.1 hypothetical protein AGABI2DRAFT_145657 [Agaricus bisporus var. bisporus H97]
MSPPPPSLTTPTPAIITNKAITGRPDSDSEIEDSDNDEDIIWEERTLGNQRSDWITAPNDIPKPMFLGIRDTYPEAWTNSLSENIKHEFNNKSKLYVLAAFAGARKNDFKLKAIIQATNSVLKYPNPAITESDVKHITLGNNSWYIMKLHKKEQAAILTNAGFVYTTNVVKPQTLSAFSLKVMSHPNT